MIPAVITILWAFLNCFFAIFSYFFKNLPVEHHFLCNNQINSRALIGQSAVGYCASKLTEKTRVFWIII